MAGTILTGNPSNITTSLSATITALANNGSGAVRATTSAPHLFGNGDTCLIFAGPITGEWAITVIDSTHFDLVGSTFTSTATGTAIDLALTPQIQVPVDGDTQSAQLSGLVSGFQGVLDRTQYLQENAIAALYPTTRAQYSQASVWSPPQLVSTTWANFSQDVGSGGPEWDPVNHQWLQPCAIISGTSVTAAHVFCSYDGWDSNWRSVYSGNALNLSGATASVVTAGKDPGDSTTFYMAVIVAGAVTLYRTHSGNWQNVYSDSSHTYTDAKWVGLQGYETAFIGSTATAGTILQYSNTQFGSATTVAVGTLIGGAVAQWLVRSNGVMGIAVPQAQAMSSFAASFVLTSTDGHTWVDQNGSGVSSVLLSTDEVIGLDWNADYQMWVMAVLTSAVKVKFLVSADGINWANQGVALSTLSDVEDIAAVGGVYTAVSGEAADTKIYASFDTKNWYLTSAHLPGGGVPVRIRSNGSQMCASSPNGARFSMTLKPIAGPLT
jgi:hypothetical protein